MRTLSDLDGDYDDRGSYARHRDNSEGGKNLRLSKIRTKTFFGEKLTF
jgi:hypothetical protein